MAIKPRVHEFFARYRHDALAIIIVTQLTSAFVAILASIFLVQWLYLDGATTLVVSSSLFVACNVAGGVLLFVMTSSPLRILTQAIAHVSKDPVATPPPDITAHKHEASGLKALVQTIYELAVASQHPGDATKQTAKPMFKELLDNLPCGVIALDAKGEVTYANALAPVSPQPNNTQSVDLIFEQNDNFATWLADCKANKVRDTHAWQRVADKIPGEESRRLFDVTAYYQKDDHATSEVLLVAFDRTAMYAPDQEDMDFIALAAHELRGPITVIRGYLDVLNEELGEKLDEDQKVLVERLQVSAERLSSYINNILNVSRYDRNQFGMHPQEEQLIEVFKSLVPDLALRAKTQSRNLIFRVPSGLPSIAADRSSISEVVINLIDNAIKYSHVGGKIIIGAVPKDNFVEVTIQDDGIGMPESVVGGLFNRFYRSHRSKGSVGGTGLGLYICKTIIEAHGGSIWVRSKEGEGSTFGFTIPTYASVADKLAAGDNEITQRSEGWIKNHAMYRR